MHLKYWAAPLNEAIDLICKGEHKTLYNNTDYVYDCCEDWCKGDSPRGKPRGFLGS